MNTNDCQHVENDCNADGDHEDDDDVIGGGGGDEDADCDSYDDAHADIMAVVYIVMVV